ncbi:MAG: peroxiredoxin family protein [Isosphaeraceae bacterium]
MPDSKQSLGRILVMVVLVGVGLAAWYRLGKGNVAVGGAAPEITGTDLDGKPMKLSDFRGKIVMLDFWGDW